MTAPVPSSIEKADLAWRSQDQSSFHLSCLEEKTRKALQAIQPLRAFWLSWLASDLQKGLSEGSQTPSQPHGATWQLGLHVCIINVLKADLRVTRVKMS